MDNRIDSNNISFDIDIIKDCISDMSGNIDEDNRSKFFDSIVVDRLDKCNKQYLDEYDRDLDRLLSLIEDGDISMNNILRSIKKIGRHTRTLYNIEMSIYNII